MRVDSIINGLSHTVVIIQSIAFLAIVLINIVGVASVAVTGKKNLIRGVMVLDFVIGVAVVGTILLGSVLPI